MRGNKSEYNLGSRKSEQREMKPIIVQLGG